LNTLQHQMWTSAEEGRAPPPPTGYHTWYW